MSQAWIRLHAAVHILGQEGSARTRLATAYSHYLLGMKPKEVPPEIRADFIRLTQWVAQQRKIARSAFTEPFASAKDAEVTLMIRLLIDMYDAVTRYEPLLAPSFPRQSNRHQSIRETRSAA